MKIGNIVFRQGTEIYKCPRCDSYIRPNQNYCSECGQALDWSDMKNDKLQKDKKYDS